jgi:diaminopimelate decarboxylase
MNNFYKLLYNRRLLNKLTGEYGDSYYLFSKQKFLRNLTKIESSFRNYYPNFSIAYSLKTNYMPVLCNLVRQHGSLVEVVSGLEYDLASKLGFEKDKIIYNGPVKRKVELFRAFNEGANVQFDSYEEIKILKAYLNTYPDKTVRCAVRCNFDIGESEVSRFGFDLDSGDVKNIYKELFSLKGCAPVGIHCHFNTKHKSLSSFQRRTSTLIEASKQIFQNEPLEYINIGGGMFGEVSDAFQALFPYRIPSLDEYGSVIGNLMKKNFESGNVKLIAEPGVAIVADTMIFICRVVSIKKFDSTPIITITGSLHNIRPSGSEKKIPFIIIHGTNQKHEIQNGIIGGYTCLESDLISKSFDGKLAVGDFLVFENTGAYSIVLKPPFIEVSPPVIMVEEKNGKIRDEIVKKRESVDQMFGSYVFPTT